MSTITYADLPTFKRTITAGDRDVQGDTIVAGKQYDLEWLRPDHVFNGGFEASTSLTDWTLTLGSGLSIVVESWGGAHSGNHTLHSLVGTANAYRLRNDHLAPVNRRYDYIVRCWARDHGANYDLEIKLGVNWRDKDNNEIQIDFGTLTTFSSSTWKQLTETFTPPAGAVYAYALVDKPTGAKGNGHIDDVEFFPSLDQRSYVAPGGGTPASWQQDNPSFAVLVPNAEETLTFDRLLSLGSGAGVDDPVARVERQDGVVRARRRRGSKVTHTLVFRRIFRGYAEQLARFHRKVRGQTFTYLDEFGDSHTVRWPGTWSWAQISNPAMAAATIVLVEDDPAWL